MHPYASAARPFAIMGDLENIDERRRESRREADRNPWLDPRLWVSVGAVLLTVAITILGYIAAQLSVISTSLQATRDTMLTVTTRQSAQIDAQNERIEKLENAMDTQTKAYNFNFSTRLAVVEAKAGVKPSNAREGE